MKRIVTGLAGLVLVQVLIAEVSTLFGDGSSAGHLIFGLHALNGLLILGVTEMIMQRSWKLARTPAETVPTAAPVRQPQ